MKDADTIIRECSIPERVYQVRGYQVYFKQDQGVNSYYVRRNEK